MLRQRTYAVESLLRQHHVCLGPLLRGFARSDDLRARADTDVRKLRFGDGPSGDRLRVLGNCLGVIDLNEYSTRRDVLPTHDRDLGDAPVDPRGNVKPRRIDLTLHQQWHRPDQIPDRQATYRGGYQPDTHWRNARSL